MATPAQIAREVRVRARAELVARAIQGERSIDAAWSPIFRRLRRSLQRATPAQVQLLIDAAVREMTAVAIERISRGLDATSTIGARAAATQHARLTGLGGPMHDPTATGIQGTITEQQRRTLVEAREQGAFVRDRVPLSQRLFRNLDETSRSAGQVIRSSVEAREGIFQAAETFIEQNRESIRVPIPRYTQDLIDAAHRALDTGDRGDLLETIERHQQQMDALGIGASRRDGTSSLRSAVRQFAHDLQQATPQTIDALVQRHIEDRAQYQARRIARTEMAEAHRQSYLAGVREQPYVVGIRWTLSPAHPRADVCDCYANQDLHGLGPGGYPADQYPETPHPHCLCTPESILDPHYFRRQLAERDGTVAPPRPWESGTHETAEQWLARQPGSFQRELLGPTRHGIFRDPNDSRRVIDNRGRPIPVGDVLGAPAGRAPATTVPLVGGVAAIPASPREPGGFSAAVANGWPTEQRAPYMDALAYQRANPTGPEWGPGSETTSRPPWRMQRASLAGRYRNDSGRTEPHEWSTDALLVSEGNNVVRPVTPVATAAPDLRIEGSGVETKAYITGGANAPARSIRAAARRQSENVIYDARARSFSREDALSLVEALLADGRHPTFLRIIGRGFDLTWQLRPAST